MIKGIFPVITTCLVACGIGLILFGLLQGLLYGESLLQEFPIMITGAFLVILGYLPNIAQEFWGRR